MKISLAGVVGVGKSTISEILKQTDNDIVIFSEPVKKNPYLNDFYNNPKDFAFRMQIFMIMERSKQLLNIPKDKDVIFDRSIYEDKIFVEVLKKMGNMNITDYKLYMDFYGMLVQENLYLKNDIVPDLFVYLKISVHNAIKRIKQRARASELIVDKAYWKLLNKQYYIWYKNIKKTNNVIKINMNRISSKRAAEKIYKIIQNNKKK
ncbi:deoxynucleoside kinase [Spiroplasma endosymbiont of Anurida maritima]|uniref:deoxynucleoside kinase n=1 Tax=Spiroplasma endosymbiont of Anurida maritima TaxID=2967972 RepID=UPI0036D30CD9